MTGHGKTLRIHLMKNDQRTVSLYPGNSGHNMGTLSMVLELKKGDRVTNICPDFVKFDNFIIGKVHIFSGGGSKGRNFIFMTTMMMICKKV
jgi:hypothetical protein